MTPARSCESCVHAAVCEMRRGLQRALRNPDFWAMYLDAGDRTTEPKIERALGEGCLQYTMQAEESRP